MNNDLNDERARASIRTDLDKSFMVEAGAGAGKTSALVERITNQVVLGKITINEIAAITFTNKAAMELKERFRIQIEKTINTLDGDIRIKENLEKAIEQLPECYIGTIHSFCCKLLRERPIEGKVQPDFEEMDDVKEKQFKEKVWYEFINKQYVENRDEILKLRKLEVEPIKLKDTYKLLCDYGDVEVICEKNSNIEIYIDQLLDEVEEIIVKTKKYIPKELEEKDYYSWQKKVVAYESKINKSMVLADKINFFPQLKEIFKGRITCNAKKCLNVNEAQEKLKEYKKIIEEGINTINEDYAKYYAEFECYEAAIAFIQKAVQYYHTVKDKMGKVGFQDLLIKTRNMLRDNIEVRRYFSNKYKHILIDEFQDTDPIQTEIMFFLAGENHEEKDWRKIKIKDGTLFIVGDPKQAIYRFRNADIALYNEVKNKLKGKLVEGGGEKSILELTTNFRSTKKICDWFNEEFKDLLAQKTTTYQAAFKRMDTYRGSLKEGFEGVWKLSLKREEIERDITAQHDKVSDEEINKQAAKQIGEFIKWSIQSQQKIAVRKGEEEELRNIQYKDFMILTSEKAEVNYYKYYLERIGIPNHATGKFQLGEYPSIQGVLNVLRVINDTKDSIALIGALKGCFGISDQMLLDAKQVGIKFDIWNGGEIEETVLDEQEIIKAYKKLREYYSWKKRYTPITTINKIIKDLRVIPISLGDQEQVDAHKHLYQIIEMLRNSEEEEILEFSQMLETLETLCMNTVEEILDTDLEEQNKVRIMNVHKSKGLEASIVILTSPKQQPNHAPTHYIERNTNGAKGYFTIFTTSPFGINSIKWGPPQWGDKKKEEALYKEAEKRRLQYVAATRAKNALILVSDNETNEVCAWKDLYRENLRELPTGAIKKDIEANAQDRVIPEIKPISLLEGDIKQVSYKWIHPTANKKNRDTIEVEEGGSKEWGDIVHQVLEKVVLEEKHLDAIMHNLIRDSEKHKGDLKKLKQVIEKFEVHAISKRIKNAAVKYTEVPFSSQLNNQGIFTCKQDEGKEVYIRGIMDLVIKDIEGWHIIDYKSDHVKSREDAIERAKAYTKQVLLYKQVWEQLVKEPVVGIELYFTHIGEAIAV